MFSLFLMFASINGFLAVALGAFAAHGLEARVSAELLATFQTGADYHMIHALALFGVAVLGRFFPDASVLRLSGYLFLAGILLFSGSLYALALTGLSWLGAITPFGGLAFLAGWGCLFRFALSNQHN